MRAWTRAAFLLFLLVLVLGSASAREGTYPGEQSLRLGNYTSQRCIMNGEYCIGEGDNWLSFDMLGVILSGQGPMVGLVETWTGGSVEMTFKDKPFSEMFFNLFGYNENYFLRACKNSVGSGEVIKWLFIVLIFIFYMVFAFFRDIGNRAILGHSDDRMEIVESIGEHVAPGWDIESLLKLKPMRVLNMKFKAAWQASGGGREGAGGTGIWKDEPKSYTGSKGSRYHVEEGFSKGGSSIGDTAEEMEQSVAASSVMDVVDMTTILSAYALPTLFFMAIVWFLIQFGGPILPFFEDGQGCFDIFFTMLVGMLWAYWLWEIIRLVLVKSAFILAMLFPKGLLKFIYIPFIGGGMGSRGMGFIMIVLSLFGLLSGALTSGGVLATLSIIMLIVGLIMAFLNAPVAMFFQMFGVAYIVNLFQPLQYSSMEVGIAFFAAMMLYAMMLVAFIGEGIVLRGFANSMVMGPVQFLVYLRKKMGKIFKTPETGVGGEDLPPEPQINVLPDGKEPILLGPSSLESNLPVVRDEVLPAERTPMPVADSPTPAGPMLAPRAEFRTPQIGAGKDFDSAAGGPDGQQGIGKDLEGLGEKIAELIGKGPGALPEGGEHSFSASDPESGQETNFVAKREGDILNIFKKKDDGSLEKHGHFEKPKE